LNLDRHDDLNFRVFDLHSAAVSAHSAIGAAPMPDVTENWRKIGPVAASRPKSFLGRIVIL
jgi:hypothetical protein